VLDKVTQATRAEVDRALREGYDEALKSIGDAEAQLMREAQHVISTRCREAQTRKAKMITSNELLYRNKRLQLMEATIEKVFTEAMARLKKMPLDATYEESVRSFMRQGIRAIGAKEVEVLANAREVEVARKIAKSLESELQVRISVSERPIECVGGVIVRTHDAATVYDNTFEARLARLRPLLKKRLSELFRKE